MWAANVTVSLIRFPPVRALWYNAPVDLLTIGYEGINLDHFFSLLRAGRVDTIVDVRELPLSRKKGFSKNALAAAARGNGFRYAHLPALGCPKAIRGDYKRDGDWSRYVARFSAYLQTQESALALLARQAQASRCCLLCFEADPNRCHRSLVARRVAEVADAPLWVVHLNVTVPALAAA